jgi:hypothetical protein
MIWEQGAAGSNPAAPTTTHVRRVSRSMGQMRGVGRSILAAPARADQRACGTEGNARRWRNIQALLASSASQKVGDMLRYGGADHGRDAHAGGDAGSRQFACNAGADPDRASSLATPALIRIAVLYRRSHIVNLSRCAVIRSNRRATFLRRK